MSSPTSTGPCRRRVAPGRRWGRPDDTVGVALWSMASPASTGPSSRRRVWDPGRGRQVAAPGAGGVVEASTAPRQGPAPHPRLPASKTQPTTATAAPCRSSPCACTRSIERSDPVASSLVGGKSGHVLIRSSVRPASASRA